VSFLHHHPEEGAHTQIDSLVLPPGVKTPTVGVLGRGPACFHRFPISFRMATLVSPIPRSTVIWFGSHDFMSTGFGYDMILLSIKGPEGARIMPTQSKALRWPHHHASPPKRRRGQHRHCVTAAARSPPRARRAAVPEAMAPRAEATDTTTRCQDSHMTVSGGGVPCAPSPPSVLLPHGLFAAWQTHLFGLDNVAASLAKTICPGAKTYVERPLVLPSDAEARRPAQQAAEQLDFS